MYSEISSGMEGCFIMNGESGGGSVSVQTFNEFKTNYDKQLSELGRVTEKRLDSHSTEITDLKVISERLLIISEQNALLLKDMRQKHEDDIKDIRCEIKSETNELKTNKSTNQSDTSGKKESFWNTEAGKQTPKWIVIGIISIAVVLVAALVGTNLIELLKAAKDIVPAK